MDLYRGAEITQIESIFYQFRNHITIYTEDGDKDKKFYLELFSRLLLDTDVKIKDIFPLGDCDKVVAACRKDKSSFPKLYIIDGDIYNMTIPKVAEENLFVLDSYCIENYIIDEQAYYNVYNELDHIHTKDEIKNIIDYNEMMETATAPFMKLFRHFALSKKLLGKFCLKNVTQVLSKSGDIDIAKIESEITAIRTQLTKKGITDENLSKEIEEKEYCFPDTYENLLRYVSGKDYLIPYICQYSAAKLSLHLGIEKKAWKYHYSKFCLLDRLSPLKNVIINITKQIA
jgi:hypothetical protein